MAPPWHGDALKPLHDTCYRTTLSRIRSCRVPNCCNSVFYYHQKESGNGSLCDDRIGWGHAGRAEALSRRSLPHCSTGRDQLHCGKMERIPSTTIRQQLARTKPEGQMERLPLKSIKGVPMIKYFADIMDEVDKFQAHPDDLVIATYPKSGTTWISEVADMIYKEGNMEACREKPIYIRVPFLERSFPGSDTGFKLLEKAPRPCLIKTHLPVKLLPKSFWEKNCKMIYLARNAKDVAVSYYFFYLMAKVHPEPGTWNEFLEKFMTGDVAFGSWYDHVKGWWDKRKEHRMLYLFYEDLKEDPQREIRKVMEFLERPIDEQLVEKIVHHTSFEKMHQNSMTNYTSLPTSVMDHSISPFMRKGITGDWKNHFTVAQNEFFDAHYERQMEGSTLQFRMEI